MGATFHVFVNTFCNRTQLEIQGFLFLGGKHIAVELIIFLEDAEVLLIMGSHGWWILLKLSMLVLGSIADDREEKRGTL